MGSGDTPAARCTDPNLALATGARVYGFRRLGVCRSKSAAKSRDDGILERTRLGASCARLPIIGDRVVADQRPIRSEADRERAYPK